MLVPHTNYSIREGAYPFVHLGEWEEFSHSVKLDVGRAKEGSDGVLSERRGAWNRMTRNFFRPGDWEIVCDWVEKHLSVLDSESRLLIKEQGDPVRELMRDAINNRRTYWDRFREKVELSMEQTAQ